MKVLCLPLAFALIASYLLLLLLLLLLLNIPSLVSEPISFGFPTWTEDQWLSRNPPGLQLQTGLLRYPLINRATIVLSASPVGRKKSFWWTVSQIPVRKNTF